MGDLENAVKHLQSALRADPDNSQVRTFYRKVRDLEEKKDGGADAFKRGAYQEAIDLWTAAIEVDKTNKNIATKLYSNRGTALFKLKQYPEAIRDCDRAIALDSEYLKAYIRRAECYYALGDAESLQHCVR